MGMGRYINTNEQESDALWAGYYESRLSVEHLQNIKINRGKHEIPYLVCDFKSSAKMIFFLNVFICNIEVSLYANIYIYL